MVQLLVSLWQKSRDPPHGTRYATKFRSFVASDQASDSALWPIAYQERRSIGVYHCMSTHRCIMSSIACSEVQFADIKIHQLQTNLGKVATVIYCFRLLDLHRKCRRVASGVCPGRDRHRGFSGQSHDILSGQCDRSDLEKFTSSFGRFSLLCLCLQDVKRGRYPKLQNTDPNILAVTTKLGLQVESRTAGTGISLLTAETVRSLMLDKRKVNSLVHSVPLTALHTTA